MSRGAKKNSKRPGAKGHEEGSSRSNLPRTAAHPTRRVEVIGIAMLMGALALSLALFSFDPSDHTGRSNLVGPVGVELAGALLGALGIVGHILGLGLVFLGGAVILGKAARPNGLTILAGASMVIALAVLAHLLSGDATGAGPSAGGAVGRFAGGYIKAIAGSAGAALVSIGIILAGVVFISDLSLGQALHDAFAVLRWTVSRANGVIEAHRAAREAGEAREEELIEAERSRRAQTKLAKEEKESRLREELEEKTRLAILRATAKAEERALVKIAQLEAKERMERERLEAEERAREAAVTAKPEPGSGTGSPIQDDGEFELSEEVALGIPGPAAEPEIIIADTGIENDLAPADSRDGTDDPVHVIESIERSGVGGSRSDADLTRGRAIEDAVESGAIDSDVEREEEGACTLDLSGGITIHERKHVDAPFAGGDEAVVGGDQTRPFDRKIERRVFQMPPLNLLDYEGTPPEPIDPDLLRGRATRLEEKLRTYGVEGRVTAIRPGPVVTTYEYEPAPGVKVSKIAGLSEDIALSMEALRVRIVAPIPGRGVVGIELPNDVRESVYLKEMVAHDSFKKSKSLLTLALGKDSEGEPQVRDLRSMPHILVAGTTGSGKSVSINTMILSILYKATPDQVKFIMVDPKMLELSLYEDIPHLLLPVVTDPRKASLALQWTVDEMERRYQMLSDLKVRDIDGFNRRLARLREQREADRSSPTEREDGSAPTGETRVLGEDAGVSGLPRASSAAGSDERDERTDAPVAKAAERGCIPDPWPEKDLPDPLPYIVVLIDEFADLMCVAPRDVEASVQRLAQKARAAGIHVMLATQRPSTDVITGVIKNNFPSRISFRVASRHDSATILNGPGAENLLGMGDMLCLGVSSPAPTRIHGAYVSEAEVQRVVDFWKAQAKPSYDPSILKKRDEDESDGEEGLGEHDEMYDRAVAIVTETRRASISAIQRRLRVGYNRAARMIEMMEAEGIVGPASGPKGEREVLVRAISAEG